MDTTATNQAPTGIPSKDGTYRKSFVPLIFRKLQLFPTKQEAFWKASCSACFCGGILKNHEWYHKILPKKERPLTFFQPIEAKRSSQ
ncbi:hypothetical protein CDAR_368311 [Caerostris darwini]|uniref:LAGLIDADG homing endonuclease n=1 Tax=Caerostris darwini TaxID=1538125 RepID=A0AAV4WG06_9ARAC|nr:hypothetical protein CDAR_368311 [Caerostris darwini]